ncbi:hypothetical protein BDQ94DRAFT_111868 [Aspergillus welwitschiae]|uniref:Uncharacterized protein n=1 Tax=Aspergillus welwitschiae TaxID=1341132 RepID=A0A3F3PL45_9EURO|nr:hypothetical protein BDQ94DRAFT_111868 [Aspergillus welwitschiae]RDH27655.1 hypothetical protein BDQ94DRAFT_111868 [Aspergillus welwitschiae]
MACLAQTQAAAPMLINATSSLVTPASQPAMETSSPGRRLFFYFFTMYAHGEERTTADIADITVQSRCLYTRNPPSFFFFPCLDKARSGNVCGSPHANIHPPEAFSLPCCLLLLQVDHHHPRFVSIWTLLAAL